MCARALHPLLPPHRLDGRDPRSWLLVPSRDRIEHRKASGHERPESSRADRAPRSVPARRRSPEPELLPAHQRGPGGGLGLVLLSRGERPLRAIQFYEKPVLSGSDRCGTDWREGGMGVGPLLLPAIPAPPHWEGGTVGNRAGVAPCSTPFQGSHCALSLSQP